MSNFPSRIPVLRRRPLATSKKFVTTNVTTNGVKIRFHKSTTTQQPQITYQGKIIIIEDLLRRVEERVRALDRAVTESQLQRVSGKQREPEDLSARWQTINLVLHAFVPFVWRHMSDIHKEELREYGMKNFLDIHYVKWGEPCPARVVARRVYDTIDLDLMHLAEHMLIAKQDVSMRRNPLARPVISDAEVREFLEAELGDGAPDLHPLEIAAFDFIKERAITDENIQEANRHFN